MKNELVTLEWYECEQAIFVAGRREAECIRREIESGPFADRPSVEGHLHGSGAEKAVGKSLNLNWNASVNTFHGGGAVADVGERIEVRWRSRDDYDLIVRPDDPDDRIYVLVRGVMPKYEIIGWIKGKDAKRPEFWKNPGNHKPAWFVPEKHLRPFSELLAARLRMGDEP